MPICSDCIRSYWHLLLLVTLDFLMVFFWSKDWEETSEPSVGDGALKSVEVWRTGQEKLLILGSVDIVEYADMSGRLGGTR